MKTVRRLGVCVRVAARRAGRLKTELRTGAPGPSLKRRRAMVAVAVVVMADAAIMALYQLGVLRRLPEPPTRGFDSNAVVASRAAYLLGTPDAALNALQLAAVIALAGAGGARPRGAVSLLLGLTVLSGAVGAVGYVADMILGERRACYYCIPAAAVSLALVPLAWPDMRQGLR